MNKRHVINKALQAINLAESNLRRYGLFDGVELWVVAHLHVWTVKVKQGLDRLAAGMDDGQPCTDEDHLHDEVEEILQSTSTNTDKRITDAELERLEGLLTKATPGIWEYSGYDCIESSSGVSVLEVDRDGHVACQGDDWTIIIAAVNALPKLIAEIKKLRKQPKENTSELPEGLPACEWRTVISGTCTYCPHEESSTNCVKLFSGGNCPATCNEHERGKQ